MKCPHCGELVEVRVVKVEDKNKPVLTIAQRKRRRIILDAMTLNEEISSVKLYRKIARIYPMGTKTYSRDLIAMSDVGVIERRIEHRDCRYITLVMKIADEMP